MSDRVEKIAVIGLGYVGLPLALAFGKKFKTIGFDISAKRVEELRAGHDSAGEVPDEELKACTTAFTHESRELYGCTFFVIAVPTPVDRNNVPDLTALLDASAIVGPNMTHDSVVVYESTVYPGVTEEICVPALATSSGFAHFSVGYSPERINPGDHEHTLKTVVKVVAAQDNQTLARIATVYGEIVPAGLYLAPSIKVAEAAKVIENTQRDLNIALMNELAIIFDRMGIRTADVLAAARTKWNFLPFAPGLVGGHCIGVDPYYLTTKAQQLGYQPEVILAGRRINNNVGRFVAQKLVKMLVTSGAAVRGAKVGILGLTFKENCSDLRNSKVPDIIDELEEYGINPIVHDPRADPAEAERAYGLQLSPLEDFARLDGLIVAVAHDEYVKMRTGELQLMLHAGGCLVDVKSIIDPVTVYRTLRYWSL